MPRRLPLGAVLIVLLVGCGPTASVAPLPSPVSTPASIPSPVSSPTPIPEPTLGQTYTVSSDGGTITSAGIQLDIPSGCISGTATLTVAPVPEAQAAQLVLTGTERLSPLYDVQFGDAAVLSAVGVTIPYDQADIEGGDIFMAVNHDGRWTEVLTAVDAEAHVVRGLVPHFSLIGLFRDILGQCPQIDRILMEPDPYIYQTADFKMTRDIGVTVLVRDPANRVQEAHIWVRLYTVLGGYLTDAVRFVASPWSLVYHQGKAQFGEDEPLKKGETDALGVTRYSGVVPVSTWDFAQTTGLEKVCVDIELQTDGRVVLESRCLFISDQEHYWLISPADGDMFGSTPSFSWKTDNLVDSNARVEVRICDNPDLQDRLFGGCEIVEIDQSAHEISTDEAPHLNAGRYWWGIATYGSLSGILDTQTQSNLFTIVKGPWATLTVEGTRVTRKEIANDTGENLDWLVYQDSEVVLDRGARNKSSGTDEQALDLAEVLVDPGEYRVFLAVDKRPQGSLTPISKGNIVVIPEPTPVPPTAVPSTPVPPTRAAASVCDTIVAYFDATNRGDVDAQLALLDTSHWSAERLQKERTNRSGQSGSSWRYENIVCIGTSSTSVEPGVTYVTYGYQEVRPSGNYSRVMISKLDLVDGQWLLYADFASGIRAPIFTGAPSTPDLISPADGTTFRGGDVVEFRWTAAGIPENAPRFPYAVNYPTEALSKGDYFLVVWAKGPDDADWQRVVYSLYSEPGPVGLSIGDELPLRGGLTAYLWQVVHRNVDYENPYSNWSQRWSFDGE